MSRRALFAIAAVVALVVSCHESGTALETPQAGYKCGTGWQPCVTDQGKPLGTCCMNVEVCGGHAFDGCPAGSCCAVDQGDEIGAPRAGGWRRIVPQVAATR